MERIEKLIGQALQGNLEHPINLLPMLREVLKKEEPLEDRELHELMDYAISQDMQPRAFNGEVPGFKVIAWCIHEDDKQEVKILALLDQEPDRVAMSYHFGLSHINCRVSQITFTKQVLATMLLSDCSGCCDALSTLTLSNEGLFALGDISMTYHS